MPKSLAEIEKQFKDWLDFKEWSSNTLTIVFEEAEHGVIARIPYKELEGLINSLIAAHEKEVLEEISKLFVNPYLRQDKFQAYIKSRLASLKGKDV